MARRFEESEYRAKLAAMTGAELYQECESKIWLSAYANNTVAGE